LVPCTFVYTPCPSIFPNFHEPYRVRREQNRFLGAAHSPHTSSQRETCRCRFHGTCRPPTPRCNAPQMQKQTRPARAPRRP
jgi:hypothetical protein